MSELIMAAEGKFRAPERALNELKELLEQPYADVCNVCKGSGKITENSACPKCKGSGERLLKLL